MSKGFRSKVTINEKGLNRYVDIDKSPFIIGRANTADVVIPDELLSRRHAEISIENETVWVQDLGSINGTWLDGKKLKPNQKTEFKAGQFLSFGSDEELSVSVLLSSQTVDLERTQVNYKISGSSNVVQTVPLPTKAEPAKKRLSVVDTTREIQGEQNVIEQIKSLIRIESNELVEQAKIDAEEVIKEAKARAAKKIGEVDKYVTNKLESLKIAEGESQNRVDEIKSRHDEFLKKIEELKVVENRTRLMLNKLKQENKDELANIEQERVLINQEHARLQAETHKVQESFQKLAEEERQSRERIELDNMEAQEKIAELRNELKEIEYQARKAKDDSEEDILEAKERLSLVIREIEASEVLKEKAEQEVKRLKNEVVDANANLDKISIEQKHLGYELERLNKELKLATYNLELTQKEQEINRKDLEKRSSDLNLLREELNQREHDTKVLFDRTQYEANAKLAEASAEAKRIINEAQETSQNLISKGEEDLKVLVRKQEEARSEFEKVKGELLRRVNQAQEEMQAEINKGKAEAEKLVVAAKSQADNIHAQAKKESDHMLAELRNEIVNRQKESLQAFTVTEEKRKAVEEEIVRMQAEAHQRIATLDEKNQAAMEAAKAQFEELNTKLQKEHEQMKQRLANDMAARSKALADEANKKAEAQRAQLEEDYNKQKAKQEASLAQLNQIEVTKMKDLRQKSEQEWANARNERANAVSSSVYALVYSEMLKAKNKVIDDTMIDTFGKELQEMILDIMLGRAGADSDRLQKLLKTSINSKEKEKAFWRKCAYAGGSLVFVTLLLLAFPSIYTGPRDAIHSAFTEKSTDMADNFAQKQLKEAKERFNYNPETTYEHKSTYVDNVLFTTDFMARRSDKAFQDKWILELNDYFINRLDVKDTTIIKFVSLEANFLKDLAKLKTQIDPQKPESGIEEMRAREKEFKDKLSSIFADPEKVGEYYRYSEKFWNDFYKRQPANDKK